MRFPIGDDIEQAHCLPTAFYSSDALFAEVRDKIFLPSWQWVGSSDAVKHPESVYPFMLLPGMMDEPLLLTRTKGGELHCLSNLCTHRGSLLATKGGFCATLRCAHHGRHFSLEGTCLSMPGKEAEASFPSPEDHLPQLPLFSLGKFLFTSLRPALPPVLLFQDLIRRVSWMPLDQFMLDGTRSHSREVQAHWALVIDEHLAPFDPQCELFPWSAMHRATAAPGSLIFDLPVDHPDFGADLASIHFWIFPNLFFHFFPWGLRVTLVKPIHRSLTQVRELTYIWRPELMPPQPAVPEPLSFAEAAQHGIASNLYHRGRFSPLHDRAVHHFHKMISKLLG